MNQITQLKKRSADLNKQFLTKESQKKPKNKKQKTKNKNKTKHMTVSLDAEKAFDKIQHIF